MNKYLVTRYLVIGNLNLEEKKPVAKETLVKGIVVQDFFAFSFFMDPLQEVPWCLGLNDEKIEINDIKKYIWGIHFVCDSVDSNFSCF